MSRENAEEVWAYCERMGYECATQGADTINCYYDLFSTPERTAAWERGKKRGEASMKLEAEPKP